MDESTRRAMEKWPNVPDVYGWLSLDRRGRWRIAGESVTHPGIIETINRNYQCDQRGAWFFQNGPQRVFVRLEATPWILSSSPEVRLQTHTGLAVDQPAAAYMDEDGGLLVSWTDGVGVIDDRDLPELFGALRFADDRPATEDALMEIMRGNPMPVWLNLDRHRLPLMPIRRAELPARFAFIPDPAPAQAAAQSFS